MSSLEFQIAYETKWIQNIKLIIKSMLMTMHGKLTFFNLS